MEETRLPAGPRAAPQWQSPARTPAAVFAPVRSHPAAPEIEAHLAAFASISLREMSSVALLDRMENKYLLRADMLPAALAALRNDYAVLAIEGRRLNRYRTLYFDTEDFALYRRHHAGARDRYKVRAREYVESHVTFLEVKHKTGKRRTIKSRVATPELVTELRGAPAHFLAGVCPYDAGLLAPCLWNAYSRITLVSLRGQERLTLDTDLTFAWEGATAGLPGLVIVEVKQQAGSGASPFTAWAQRRRLRPTGFSKYCMGVNLLYPGVKANRFKASHRQIARLLHADLLLQGGLHGNH